MRNRFIIGERIEFTSLGELGKVTGVRKSSDGRIIYTILLDDPNLMPRKWDCRDSELAEYSGSPTLNYGGFDFGDYQPDEKVDKEEKCPKCKIDWTITISLHGEKWRDCESCGQKYEDLK